MTDTLTLPTQQESDLAKRAARELASVMKLRVRDSLELKAEKQQQSVLIPRRAAELLVELLAQMANGNAVTLVPVHAQLTTQEAADLLNVSRPFLVKLLEANAIPFTKVGTHRRVLANDVFAYKRGQSAQSIQALNELSALDQSLGHD